MLQFILSGKTRQLLSRKKGNKSPPSKSEANPSPDCRCKYLYQDLRNILLSVVLWLPIEIDCSDHMSGNESDIMNPGYRKNSKDHGYCHGHRRRWFLKQFRLPSQDFSLYSAVYMVWQGNIALPIRVLLLLANSIMHIAAVYCKDRCVKKWNGCIREESSSVRISGCHPHHRTKWKLKCTFSRTWDSSFVLVILGASHDFP